MKPGKETTQALIGLAPEDAARIVGEMGEAALLSLAQDWPSWVHQGQEAPEGEDWRIWVMLAGRGFGKTRAGAEWVSAMARAHPGASIALVAANADEARRVMIEGRSGLLAAARLDEPVVWLPSRGRLVFASGAQAQAYSGAHADSLRGPEHHFAWCDELAKWRQAQDAWNNLMLGLRAGDNPRALVTTTPRPIDALKAIIGGDDTAQSGGATWMNPHLPRRHVAAMEKAHQGTRLGRQELDGEMIDDLEGALWSRAGIEACRAPAPDRFRRVVVGVDPPASVEGTCGIVACGVDMDGVAYVLGDHSVGGVSPEGWAKAVAAAAARHGAHRVVAEVNNGGRMVVSVLRGASVNLPVKAVHASEGKAARAEPVAALFENGRAKLAGKFPALEDALCGLIPGAPYEGPGRSPDRADAMVWALTELMLGPARGEPRLREI